MSMRSRAARAAGDDRGSVAAEFAMVLPAVVVMLALCVGAVSAGAQHVRLQDAAADAARLVARGEPDDRARDVVVGQVDRAGTRIDRRGDLVCVTAQSTTRIAGVLPVSLAATSCALSGGL